MTKNEPILKIKKRKSKLNRVLQDAKNHSEFGCIVPELFAFKRVHKLLIHPVVRATKAAHA